MFGVERPRARGALPAVAQGAHLFAQRGQVGRLHLGGAGSSHGRFARAQRCLHRMKLA